MEFTHFNEQGRAKMVDVGAKPETVRTARAAGRVLVNRETLNMIKTGGCKKGDVLTVAQVAGIMAAKKTWELVPMCHPVQLSGIDLTLTPDEERCAVEIFSEVRCSGQTGVEMEALTAVSAAALTVYDMCKALQKDMVISDIRLLSKTGGVHGDFLRQEPVYTARIDGTGHGPNGSKGGEAHCPEDRNAAERSPEDRPAGQINAGEARVPGADAIGREERI